MARSVILGIASACIALAVTATIATPSQAMSFSDYDNSSAGFGNRADVNELFSGRLVADRLRDAEHKEAVKDLRKQRGITSSFKPNRPEIGDQRPISLTLPF